jgi:hypothetical protein
MNDNDQPISLSVNMHPSEILEEAASKIDELFGETGFEFCPTDPKLVAAQVILVLGKYGLLDGGYYQVVKYARTLAQPKDSQEAPKK